MLPVIDAGITGNIFLFMMYRSEKFFREDLIPVFCMFSGFLMLKIIYFRKNRLKKTLFSIILQCCP